MVLTKKQEEGLNLSIKKFKTGAKYIVIAGYAGTGKSTLVKFLIEALTNEANINPEEDVCYAAYTGKACQVLSQMGNKNTSTLHRLMYESIPLPNGGFRRKKVSQIDYKIVVIDEISMVPQDMVTDLFKYDCFFICLGDPFQLPPIEKDNANHLLDKPDVFLDEIMRQAAESEIIRYTLDLRQGKELPFEYEGNEIRIYPKSELCDGMLTWADIILCATNKERKSLNQACRRLLGLEGEIQDGDKVVCTQNDWEVMSDTGMALVNGCVGHIQNPFENFIMIPKGLPGKAKKRGTKLEIFQGDFISESQDKFPNIRMDRQLLEQGTKYLDWHTEYYMGKDKIHHCILPDYFEFGYALTCWKAQGSQWNKVLVVEENFPYVKSKEEHARWLYTALTRAIDKVTLVRRR